MASDGGQDCSEQQNPARAAGFGAISCAGKGRCAAGGRPDLRDRVIQAALKLVLEPTFEANLQALILWLPAKTPDPSLLPRRTLPLARLDRDDGRRRQ
jgi:hypothetical protein